MASIYTTGFGIEKIGSGEQAGAWGTTTNHNADIIDRIASYKAVALSGTTHTLTVREASPGSGTGNLQDGMYRVIKFTGALGANNTVTVAPNTAPVWFIIENATTDSGSGGPYSVILTQGSGANVTVQNGKNAIIYCDGAGSGAVVYDALADLQVGTLEATGVTGGTITASTGFSGPGASITGMSATQLTTGTVPSAALTGTYAISVSGSAASATTATTATTATNINISGTTSTDTATYPVLVGTNSTGNQQPFIDNADLSYNASTGALSSTSFVATSLLTDTIDEKTVSVGVTIESVLLKDGNVGIGTSTTASALSFAIGTSPTIGQTAVTNHAAGNVGSIGIGISDGGGYSGVYVYNTHNGTYSSQDIRFFSAEGGISATTERMRITSGGSVGIGSSTPESWYGVNATLLVNRAQNADTMIGIGNSTAGSGASTSIYMVGGTGNSWANQSLRDNTGSPYFISQFGSAVTYASWYFGGTERMRITSTGALSSTSFAGSGASLTALSATQLTTGTVPSARLSEASAANIRAGTANVLVTPANMELASEEVVIPWVATTTPVNWSAFLNGTITMTGDTSLGVPTNAEPGTWRIIRVTQDATGGRTLGYASQYKTQDGADPQISAAAYAKDTLYIYCVSASEFQLSAGLNWS